LKRRGNKICIPERKRMNGVKVFNSSAAAVITAQKTCC